MSTRLIVIAVLDLILLGAGLALGRVDTFKSSAVSWAVAAIGIVTLLGLLAGRDENTKVTTRFALTVAVAALWFASVGSLLFHLEDPGPLPDEAFTGISLVMGVVVAFYFGAQAYEAVGKAKALSDPVSQPTRTRGGATRGGVSTDDEAGPPVEIYD